MSFLASLSAVVCFLFPFICIPNAGWSTKKWMDKEKKREKTKKRDLHELPYKEIAKAGTLRLAFGIDSQITVYSFIYYEKVMIMAPIGIFLHR